LKGASAVAAAGVAPYFVPASAFGAGAPSERITLACIGVGNQGAPVMQRFLNQPGCQVVAVCDVNRGSHGYRSPEQYFGREPAKKMVEEFYAEKTGAGSYAGCDMYADFRDVLARDDVDAVTVCVPDHWHALMTCAAAAAKKDVYCEKPLSYSIGEGRAMVNAVRKHGIVLQTGTQNRSDALVRQACELVRNGYIGDVRRVTTLIPTHNIVGPGPGWKEEAVPEGFDYDMWLGPAPEAPYHSARCLYNFRFIYDYAGGQVTNFGAHSNDFAQWGLGMDGSGPVEVESLEAKFLPDGSLFTAATDTKYVCRYANGAELVCMTGDPACRAVFEGSEGKVSVDSNGQNFHTEPASLAKVVLRDDQLLAKSDDHHLSFLQAVKSRQDPCAPVETGHSSATVCHLGNIAVRLRAKLKWDPAKEVFAGNDEAQALVNRTMRGPWQI
jgi:predicted dehydrogenase